MSVTSDGHNSLECRSQPRLDNSKAEADNDDQHSGQGPLGAGDNLGGNDKALERIGDSVTVIKKEM